MQRTNSWHDADASRRGKESATMLNGNLGVQAVLTERQARNNSFSIGWVPGARVTESSAVSKHLFYIINEEKG